MVRDELNRKDGDMRTRAWQKNNKTDHPIGWPSTEANDGFRRWPQRVVRWGDPEEGEGDPGRRGLRRPSGGGRRAGRGEDPPG